MTREDLETLDSFELWLRSQPPNAIVGEAAMACGCPLANWGRSILGGQTTVDEGTLWGQCGDRFITLHLTEICELFVHKVDAFMEAEITAREALEILQECRWEIAATTMGATGIAYAA